MKVTIIVTQVRPLTIKPASRDETVKSDKKLRGKILELTKKCPIKDLTVLIQAKQGEGESWRVVAAGNTDASGNFSMPYPYGAYHFAQAIVSLTPDKPADISIREDGDPNESISDDFLYLLITEPNCPEMDKKVDCDCSTPEMAKRLPDQEDLINSSEYTQDIGGSCVNLSKPNRTLSERNYQAIVRTSDPQVANYTLRKIKRSSTFSVFVQPAASTGITTTVPTVSTEIGAPLPTRFELVGGAATIKRSPVDLNNPIRWQDAPDDKNNLSFYQAVTVATGHILHLKTVTKADGYSLGDLLYSLALAPGQKKQIVVFDSSHTLNAAESQNITQEDSLTAALAATRDIDSLLGGGLNEFTQGRSSANTSGVSAGLGVAANLGVVSGALGVAGGASTASSSASQNGSRNVSQYFQDKLRQSVMQSANDFRQLNASVVTSVQEGQRYAATTEVVSNHNHCHALTMMYFEVLRHFAVYQELANVEECVFVPLLLTEFSVENIYKWKDVLASHLLRIPSNTYLQPFNWMRPHPLLKAFDANERIKTNYVHVDFPAGRYCDETITGVSGRITFRADIPRPKTRFDRILSLPIIRKTVTTTGGIDVQGTIRDNVKDSVIGALTGGLLPIFGGGPSVKYTQETHEVLTKQKIFDAFMTLDENYESVSPAQCIRVHSLSPMPYFDGSTTRYLDFFASQPDDKKLWQAYAAVLGIDIYELMDRFAHNVISDWDKLFYEDIAPLIIKKLINESTIIPLPLGSFDLTSTNKYSGREQLLSYNFTASTSLTRAAILQISILYSFNAAVSFDDRDTLIKYLTLNVEDLTVNYSTAHYSGRIFSGYVGNDLLELLLAAPTVIIPTPLNSDEKRNARLEDLYLVNSLIEHLNSNLEHYNRTLWYNLDVDRRFMLLDGFDIEIFDDRGISVGSRSLASVVKNELIAVAGNSLVLSVAPGYRVSESYIVEETANENKKVTLFEHYKPLTPIPPYRISLPSRGVFVEAVQGACDACEKEKENSSQDWTKFKTDEPTPIATIQAPVPTITDWKAAWKEFAPPLINIQNAPAAPEPGAGLGGITELLGKTGLFKNITGLDANQQNAIRTYLSNQENAKAFAEMAKGLASQDHNTQHADKITESLKTAKDSGAITQDQYAGLTKDHIQQQIDGGEAQKRQDALASKKLESSPIRSAVDLAQSGTKVSATESDATGQTRTLDIGPNPDFQLAHEVTPATGLALKGLEALTKNEYERRIRTNVETIHRFPPKGENTLVLWASEFTPPEGLTVKNWAHPGVKKYTVDSEGKRLPRRRPDDILQVILHETAGWANIGAGTPWSVHFTIGPDAIVYQHCDVALFCEHGNQMNPFSVGIEFTNWSAFSLGAKGHPPLTPSGKSAPITDLQGGRVGGTVIENRQRIPISWISGNPGNGSKGDYYTIPPVEQLGALAKLVKWLTGGPLDGAAIDASPRWRQLIDHPEDPTRKLFAMSFNPVFESAVESSGIMPHILFQEKHFDGSAQGLYTWLVVDRGFDEAAAYAEFLKLISVAKNHIQVSIQSGRKTRNVQCVDVTAIADRNI